MSHFLISAAHKSSGKTTVSLGLCAALRNQGNVIQPFKKGPDYIDPMWLSRASGRDCYNLDFYTMDQDEIIQTFSQQMQGADIGIIEGNKGLYDGLDIDGSNSNAALASLLDAPVILVIDARGMTRGIAPLVLGYQAFDSNVNIKGVILNQVGGSRHEAKLRSILEHYTNVSVLGAVHKSSELEIDERHLGLIPSNEEHAADKKIKIIANLIQNQVDLDKIREIADEGKSIYTQIPLTPKAVKTDVRIGLARDEAFGFYYPGDLNALKQAGAELVMIDTLRDSEIPDIDGLFIGGGFPETQMHALEANSSLRSSLLKKIKSGLPVYAECGGLMYLSRKITWKDETCEMVGAIPADTLMHEKPQGRGYIRLRETGQGLWPNQDKRTLYGHEFHYSELVNMDKDLAYSYSVERGTGIDGKHDGIVYKNVIANYAHLRDVKHFHWAKDFVNFVRSVKNNVQR
jgi:cobyrinic acid a,c-diamide synthase